MREDIAKAIQELTESIDQKHGWAVLKSHIEEIDEVIAGGVKAGEIERALNEVGLELAPTALRSALYRYRKKRKAAGVDSKYPASPFQRKT